MKEISNWNLQLERYFYIMISTTNSNFICIIFFSSLCSKLCFTNLLAKEKFMSVTCETKSFLCNSLEYSCFRYDHSYLHLFTWMLLLTLLYNYLNEYLLKFSMLSSHFPVVAFSCSFLTCHWHSFHVLFLSLVALNEWNKKITNSFWLLDNILFDL